MKKLKFFNDWIIVIFIMIISIVGITCCGIPQQKKYVVTYLDDTTNIIVDDTITARGYQRTNDVAVFTVTSKKTFEGKILGLQDTLKIKGVLSIRER